MELTATTHSSAYNALSHQIEEQEKSVLPLYSRVTAIDKIMRESLGVQSALMEHERDVLTEYLQQPEEAQNLEDAMQARNWAYVTTNLQRRFIDERITQLESFEALLGARDSDIRKGKFIPLTEAAKQERKAAFAQLLDSSIQDHLSRFERILPHVDAKIQALQKEINDKISSYRTQMDAKTALINQINALQEQVDALIVKRSHLHEARENDLERMCQTGDIARLNSELSKFFLARSKKKFVDTVIEGRPLLVIAALHSQSEMVGYLLANDANIEACDSNHYQAIHYAAKNGDVLIAERFLRKNRLVAKARGEFGRTPLHMAAYNGRDEVVSLLFQFEADPNACTDDADNKKTPLHDAVMQNRVKVVMELIGHPGLDVNIRDRLGYTPLYHAVADGLVEMVSFIIGHASFKWPEAGDPNHFDALLQLRPRQNQEQMRELLHTF